MIGVVKSDDLAPSVHNVTGIQLFIVIAFGVEDEE
jgi:hypothetical protein